MDLRIGNKLKELRIANGYTQSKLAERVGLTKGYISQIERDLTSPSLSTLAAILSELGTSMGSFFRDDSPEKAVFKRSERILARKSRNKTKVELLVKASHRRQMEPALVTLGPGAATWEDRSHNGEEFGLVTKGKICLKLGKHEYHLEEGDCFYFSADKRHVVANTGHEDAEIVWVVTPPTL